MPLAPIKNILRFSHNKWDKHLISSKKDLSWVPMFVSHNGTAFSFLVVKHRLTIFAGDGLPVREAQCYYNLWISRMKNTITAATVVNWLDLLSQWISSVKLRTKTCKCCPSSNTDPAPVNGCIIKINWTMFFILTDFWYFYFVYKGFLLDGKNEASYKGGNLLSIAKQWKIFTV